MSIDAAALPGYAPLLPPPGYQTGLEAAHDALALGSALLEYHLVRFAADAAGGYGRAQRAPGLGVIVADERFVREATSRANGGDRIHLRYDAAYRQRHGQEGPLLSDPELAWQFLHEMGGDINVTPPLQGEDGVQVFDREGYLIGVGRYVRRPDPEHRLVRPIRDLILEAEGNFGARHASTAFAAATHSAVEAAYLHSQGCGNVKRFVRERAPVYSRLPDWTRHLVSSERLRMDILYAPEQPAPALEPLATAA